MESQIVTAEELALAKRVIKEARMMVGLDALQPMSLHPDSFVCREAFAKVLRVVVAEVREEKRKEVLAELDNSRILRRMTEINGNAAIEICRAMTELKSLQPPSPEPSERAMRVANRIFPVDHPWIHTGTPANARTLLAEIIDEEFGAGK